MTEAKLDLITKLLAKAESTTPEEAEALTEHAERLMLKYGIEQARIDARRAERGQPQEEIVKERMLFTGVYARDVREIGAGVANALDSIRPLYGERPGGGMLLFLVGYASDVRQARLLIESLQVQAMVAMRAWWAIERHRYWWEPDAEKRRARSGFLRGFGVGVAARIRENRRAIVEASGTGTDLVLASRRERVDAVARTMARGYARRRQGADAYAFARGRISGSEANTGERAVPPGGGAGRGE
ncbi:DUF2786 domain-containing protein [Microbacterium neungamense]|uniref:DUF2786 domain-containing protein n=1 Tax=Microbacterium neungamense TaxID=2810535 RepID=UPI00217DE577|nr:DUF2786 domain-containing protein [Microbacterium neungamense]UWF77598.1 DUF2786 domain-containing protein [Microbacterium neungamense]